MRDVLAGRRRHKDVRFYSSVLDIWTGHSSHILRSLLLTFFSTYRINIEVEYLEDRDVIERPIRARPVVQALHKVCIIARMRV